VTAEVERGAFRTRYGLLLTALAPLVPQILGSAFNIWYNATVVEPMFTPALRQRFFATVILYNAVVYPIGVYLWLKRIFSFRHLLRRLSEVKSARRGERVPELGVASSESLTQARRRLIHLP
jgi:adenylate cyclase